MEQSYHYATPRPSSKPEESHPPGKKVSTKHKASDSVTSVQPSAQLLEPSPVLVRGPSYDIKLPFKLSIDSLDSEYDMMEKALPLPPKRCSRFWRNMRYTVFSTYRRLFTLVFVGNMIAFLILLVRHKGITGLPLTTIGTAVSANLTISIVTRQEWFVNALFIVFGACPYWVPLRIRRVFAKVYHFGGLHSGCGVAAVVWFILFAVVVLRSYVLGDPTLNNDPAVLVITMVVVVLLVGIVVFAHPRLRVVSHNSFEAVHRFAGWSSVILFWVHTIVLSDFSRQGDAEVISLGRALVLSPTFWFLIVITICIILPWLRLRKVAVQPEYLSNHAIRLHFSYTKLKFCSAIRITHSPLKEWHAFAGIPARDGKSFSLIVSNAGDWTKQQISRPPTKLWVRGIPTKGVLCIAQIFRRVVIVATGSGVGPCLSMLVARPIDCRMLWSTPNPEETYGHSIVNDVLKADPCAMIIDTRKTGRPDLVKLTYDLYVESGAEACFIISNLKVTRKVVYGLESRGVPIFAPIFDS